MVGPQQGLLLTKPDRHCTPVCLTCLAAEVEAQPQVWAISQVGQTASYLVIRWVPWP